MRKHLVLAGVVCGLILMLRSVMAQTNDEVVLPSEWLVETAEFSLPKQYQVHAFLPTKNAIFASVACNTAKTGSNSVLAAWSLDGILLWRTDTPRITDLLLADNQIVGVQTYPFESEIVWFDARTGKLNHRARITGRVSNFTYFPKAKTVAFAFSNLGSPSIDEIQAYNSVGQMVWWKRSFDNFWASTFYADSNYFVVNVRTNMKDQALQRLDPATGEIIWQREFSYSDEKMSSQLEQDTTAKQITVDDLRRYAPFASWRRELFFIDLETGELSYKLALPREYRFEQFPIRFTDHPIQGFIGDQLYLRLGEAQVAKTPNPNWMAVDFPSGQLAWLARTESYGQQPVGWGENVVFTSRETFAARGGYQTKQTEMRIYNRLGKLIVYSPTPYDNYKSNEETKHWDDITPVVAVGNTLYASNNISIVALRFLRGIFNRTTVQ